MLPTRRQKLEKFEAYTLQEPKLRELYYEIKNVNESEIAKYGLITKMWLEKYKPQFVHLVGPQRATKDELASNEAYKLVYDTLFNVLPYGNIDEEEYDEWEEEPEGKMFYDHYLSY